MHCVCVVQSVIVITWVANDVNICDCMARCICKDWLACRVHVQMETSVDVCIAGTCKRKSVRIRVSCITDVVYSVHVCVDVGACSVGACR